MARLVDLTMPIRDHFRWPVTRELRGDFARGDPFQVTWLGWSVHAFTHIDAPRHMVPGGPTTSDLRLEQVVGSAAVLDLTAVEPGTGIREDTTALAGRDLRCGDIALLKTCWETRRSPDTPEFWTEAPYLTRAACG
jgi:arylformamidase